jgi:hypothetical protein
LVKQPVRASPSAPMQGKVQMVPPSPSDGESEDSGVNESQVRQSLKQNKIFIKFYFVLEYSPHANCHVNETNETNNDESTTRRLAHALYGQVGDG